jgi:hypothetical protein
LPSEKSTSGGATNGLEEQLRALQQDLDAEELDLFKSVLDIERKKLHMKRPRGVPLEIEEEIKRVIK